MSALKTINMLLLACVLVFSGVSMVSAENEHHQHKLSASKKTETEKWLADVYLQKGMANIEAEVQNMSQTFDQGRMSKKEAEKLADTIKGEIQYIVVNCKLEKEADESLHLLIHEMSSAVDVMLVDTQSVKGYPVIIEVLEKYHRYFVSKSS